VTVRALVPQALRSWAAVLATVSVLSCYTSGVDVTAPEAVVDRLAVFQQAPPLFVRDTVRVFTGDTVVVSFFPLTSGSTPVLGVMLRWSVEAPSVAKLVLAAEQEARVDVRLAAVGAGSSRVSATTNIPLVRDRGVARHVGRGTLRG